MHKPIIQGSVAWQDLYDQGYVVVKKDEYMSHWPTQEWQPIETAPEDDTDVLIFCDDGIFIGSFAAGMWWIEQQDDCRRKPTHWMPLPPCPIK
jgi:hypothetical protein